MRIISFLAITVVCMQGVMNPRPPIELDSRVAPLMSELDRA